MTIRPVAVAVMVVGVLAGACGTSARATTPTTTTSTSAAVAVDGCADATGQVVSVVEYDLGGRVTPADYGTTEFHRLLTVSLDACPTRAAWTAAMAARGSSGNGPFLDLMYRSGCAVADFLRTSAGVPVPAACVG